MKPTAMTDEEFDALARLHVPTCTSHCPVCQVIAYAKQLKQTNQSAAVEPAEPDGLTDEKPMWEVGGKIASGKIHVFLDDMRDAPIGWVRTRTVHETLKLLRTGNVAELSLDHDLGDKALGNGYDVLRWIERQVVMYGFKPPILGVHSANPPASQRMKAAIKSIARLFSTRGSRDDT